MPSVQKALLLTEKRGKELVIREIPMYKPGPGEVLIKMKATSLNPVDWRIQVDGVFYEDFPVILGTDVCGDIEEVGEDVMDLKKGDRVFTQGQFENDKASFQQYTIALASTLARIPDNVSYDAAAAIPVALNVVWVGLYNKAPYGAGYTAPISPEKQGIYNGTPIVIFGGGSSVGQNAIQVAKISGFSPIIATASLKHTEHLKSLGTTAVLDRNLTNADLAIEIAKLTKAPLQIIFDAVSSNETQQAGMDILAPGGKLVTVLSPAVAASQDKTVVHSMGILRLPQNIELLEDLYQHALSGFLEKGWLKPNIIEVLPNGLASIQEGLHRMQSPQFSRLKLVVHPDETP